MSKPEVRKHTFSDVPKELCRRVYEGAAEFSPPNGLKVVFDVQSRGWLWSKVTYTLLEPLTYMDSVFEVAAETGAASDLNSTPPWIWWIPGFAPWDHPKSGIGHDGLYKKYAGVFRRNRKGQFVPAVPKWVCDVAYLRMLGVEGAPLVVRVLKFLGVLVFGGRAWKKHAANNGAAAAKLLTDEAERVRNQ